MLNKFTSRLAWGAAALLCALTLTLTARASLQAPAWEMATAHDALIAYTRGAIGFAELLAYRTSEHQLAGGMLLFLFDWEAARGSGIFLIAMSVLAYVATTALVIVWLRSLGVGAVALAGAIAALWQPDVFGANLMWPHQATLSMCVLAALGACGFAAYASVTEKRLGDLAVGFAALCAFAASFLFGFGPPVFAVVLGSTLVGPRAWFRGLIVIAAAAPAAVLYALHNPLRDAWAMSVATHPPALDYAVFFFGVLGSLVSVAFAGDQTISVAIGAIGALLASSIVWRRMTRPSRFDDPQIASRAVLLVVVWCALSASLVTIARADSGLGQAFNGRYVVLSALFWIGVLALWKPRAPALKGAVLAAVTLVFVGLVATAPRAVTRWLDLSARIDAAAAGITAGVVGPSSDLVSSGYDARPLFAASAALGKGWFAFPYAKEIGSKLEHVSRRLCPGKVTVRRIDGGVEVSAQTGAYWGERVFDRVVREGVVIGLLRRGVRLPQDEVFGPRHAVGFALLSPGDQFQVWRGAGAEACLLAELRAP